MPRKLSGDLYGPWKGDGVHWGYHGDVKGFPCIASWGAMGMSWRCHGIVMEMPSVCLW